MQIDKVKVCEPIETLVDCLKENGFEIIEQKVSDYHFHEVYIKMTSAQLKKVDTSLIDKINVVDDNNFSCSCHWSIVEISDEDDRKLLSN